MIAWLSTVLPKLLAAPLRRSRFQVLTRLLLFAAVLAQCEAGRIQPSVLLFEAVN